MPICSLINNNSSSSILIYSKKNDSKIPSSPKRKILISPSKDLLTFFDKSNFPKYKTLKSTKNQKQNLKLTLNTKLTQRNLNIKEQPKDRTQVNKIQNIIQINSLSRPKSAMINRNNIEQKQNQQQRFKKLKKQVDLIRRKYNLVHKSKINLQSSKINNIFKSSRNSTRDISQNSIEKKSIQSKDKTIISKNNRLQKQDGRKILKKKNSSHINDRLRLTFSINNGSACEKLQDSLRTRKSSVQLQENLLTYEDQDIIPCKDLLQFTFGNMSIMDYQNFKSLNSNNNCHKLKI